MQGIDGYVMIISVCMLDDASLNACMSDAVALAASAVDSSLHSRLSHHAQPRRACILHAHMNGKAVCV